MSRLRNGQSLIGTLVAVFIAIGATAFFVTGGFGTMNSSEKERPDGKGETMIGRAMLKAEDGVCQTQLGQVRELVLLAMDPVEDTYPTALSDVSGLPFEYDRCPIGDEAYMYVPSTGKVSCPHPGHEDY